MKTDVDAGMETDIRIFIVSLLITIAFSATGAVGQEPENKCSQVKFSDRMTHGYRYRLDRIEGQAVFGNVSEKGELWGASNLCVVLFQQKDERLSASVLTESGGQFTFANVAPGNYVLIVSQGGLHEIIISVEVADRRREKAVQSWLLLLHMRSKEDPRKSFVTPITEPALRAELLKREREEQAIRNDLIKSGADHPDKSIEARTAVIDAANTARMKEIVKSYGWPGPELVGRDGTDAAFLLVQHSPDLAFQKTMLPLVQNSYEKGKLSGWSYALLVDRVLVREGKKQMYGMSVNHWASKEPVLDPIEDEANVDKRRAKLGLPPLRDYLETIKRQYFPNEK